MKRIKFLMLLCAFAVMFASPGWATTHDVVLSNDASFQKLSTDIGSASAGDVFNLSMASGYNSVDVGTTGIIVTKKITLNGNNVVFNGHSKERTLSLFTLSGDASGSKISGLTFQNFVLKNSKYQGGAAIFLNGVNADIENCSFDKNEIAKGSTSGYSGGAAIYTRNSAGTTITNCNFTDNVVSVDVQWRGTTNGSSCNEDGGGAIYNLVNADNVNAKITITKSIFQKNGVIDLSAVTNNQPYISGGALSNVIVETKSSTLSVDIKECSFDQNNAVRYGGAIYNLTDLPTNGYTGSIDISIADSSFTNNSLSAADNAGSFGGAVAFYAINYGDIKLHVENSVFKGNKALNQGAKNVANFTGGKGGAIAVTANNNTNSIVSTIANCRFEDNTANWGAAVSNWGNKGNAKMEVTDCSFMNNHSVSTTDSDLYNPNGSTYKRNPIGSGIGTRGRAGGKAYTTIINTTFTSNDTVCGGAISNYQDAEGDVAYTDIINCSFVNNVITSADYSGTDVYNKSGTVNLLNTLLWNSAAAKIISTDKGAVSLDYSALPSGATFTSAITNTNSKTISSAPTSKEVELNGIKHKIFMPTSELAAGKYTAGTTPEYDILGVKRSTSTPTIGAVELASTSGYTIVASDDSTPSILQSDDITLSADISTDFKVTFKVSPDTAIDSTYKVTWSGTLDISGLTFSSADVKITGKPTVSADTKFKPVATITTAGGYVLATVSKDFTIKITSKDATAADEAIKLSATETEVTVYAGESVDITVEATSGDNIVWTKSSGDLPSGVTAAASGDKVYTIKGTVSSSATEGAYTYKVIASNDTSVASVDIKITVKEKESEAETEYELSVTVSPDEVSVTRGATSGNTLTAEATISPDTTFTPSYQWYSNTTASTSGGTAISSATSETYAAPTDTTGTFYYFVVAKATVSGTALTVSSDVVTVTISSGTAEEAKEQVKNIIDDLLKSGDVAAEDLIAYADTIATAAVSGDNVDMSVLDGMNTSKGLGKLINAIISAAGKAAGTATISFKGLETLTEVSDLAGINVASMSFNGNSSIKTVDLEGATIKDVDLKSSAVASLSLKGAAVTNVDAKGASDLETVDVAGNETIQTLDIGETKVASLDVKGCKNLETLEVDNTNNSNPDGQGSLEELDIEGCENLKELTLTKNKLLGIKKPSTLRNIVTVRARNQARPSVSFTARTFNFWDFLWALLGNSGSYNATTATFEVTRITITQVNGAASSVTPATSGDVSFDSTPNGLQYEYSTDDFAPSGFLASTFYTTADEGMDVTLGSNSGSESTTTDDETKLPSSSGGGGCDAGFGFGALAALMAVFELKKRR